MIGIAKLAQLLYTPLFSMFVSVFAQLRDHSALEKRVDLIEERIANMHKEMSAGKYKKS